MFSLPLILQARIIVETGLSRGLSTQIFLEAVELLNNSGIASMLFTIDIEDSPETRKRLHDLKLDNYWQFIMDDSIKASEKWISLYSPIDLLYLDSDHSKAHVTRELQVWGQLVRKGGIILVDDCLEGTGTLEAVKESEFHSVTFFDAEGMCLLWKRW